MINEINSLTHSCMHSFASFAILALSGRAFFIIRATGAKLRMLASSSSALKARGMSKKLKRPRPRAKSGRVDMRGCENRAAHSDDEQITDDLGMETDVPLAIGNHLSCSFTPSNS